MRPGLYCLRTGNAVPLKKISVRGEIGACIANVRSKLVYFNDTDSPVEAQFIFPLDNDSAVYKFEALIDGRTTIAEVQERNQARETYQDAIQSGKTAFLLEEHSDTGDVFKCRLGNLPGKEPATLTISYVSELPHDPDGALRFTLPTVLNPRYGTESKQMQSSFGSPFYSGNSQGGTVCVNPGSYTLVLDVDIQSPTRILEVFSESDSLNVEYENENHTAHVNLQFGDDTHLDHDITVLYKNESMHEPQAIVERGLQNNSGIMKTDTVMMDFYPEIEETYTSNGEYIFVIDRSGSMDIDGRIERARETMLLLLKSLPVGCHFNIYSFGQYFHLLFDNTSSPEYSEQSLEYALNFVQTMQADMGGTEILQPLKDMYSRLSIQDHPKQVFLLTDGQVWNVKEICDLVRTNANTTRVFSVGIGEGASTALVKGLARAGNGKAVFVKGADKLAEKVLSLLKCAMQPTVENLCVNWELPQGVTAYHVPQTLPRVFYGERFIVYAVLNGSENLDTISGILSLQGQVKDKSFTHRLAFMGQGHESNTDASLPLHRLAAKALIQEIEDQTDSEQQKQLKEGDIQKIISISVGSNVISKHTSHVGVDKESKVPLKLTNTYHQSLATFGSAGVRGSSVGMFGSKPITKSPPIATFTFGSSNASSVGAAPRERGGVEEFASFGSSNAASPVQFSFAGGSASPFGADPPGLRGAHSQTATSFGGQSSSLFGASSCQDGFGNRNFAFHSNSNSQGVGFFGAKPINPQSSQHQQQNSMVSVVLLQKLHGYWELSQSLSDALKVSISTLQQFSPLPQNEQIWATCLALAWLKLNHSKSKIEWEIIERKAKIWLRSQGLTDEKIIDFMKTAESVLLKE